MSGAGTINWKSLRKILFLWILIPAINVQGRQFTFEQFGQEQGLGSSLIRTIVQDPSGFLWIGTRAGLYRYDGQRFQRFDEQDGLPDKHIRALLVAQDGTLWAMTAAGLAFRSGSRFKVIQVDSAFSRSRSGLGEDRKGRIYA